jgi:hypothetical protein
MEDIINRQEEKVQIIFERTHNNLIFRDALWFSDQEYAAITVEEILAMQEERFNNWITFINTPSVEEVPLLLIQE